MGYSHPDRAIGEKMERKLRALDYHVAELRDMWRPNQSLLDAAHELIDTALANGTVIFLMSPFSVRSPWLLEEARYALQRCEPDAGNVRLFIIRDPQEVHAYLWRQPEWAPFKDFMCVELTDIDSLSPAELSRLIDPPR